MLTIQHFGFDHPPIGIINILHKLPFAVAPTVYIIDPLNQPKIPYQQIQQIDKQNFFVVINTHEGASHRWFDRLIPRLNQECGVPLDQIVLHSSCLDDPGSPIQHVGSIVDYASDIRSRFRDWTQPAMNPSQYHFVCMNRMHRWQRLELVLRFLDSGIRDRGAVSYIETRHVPPSHRHQFPLVLDGHQIEWAQGHELIQELAVSAVNVITESSYEPKPGSDFFETHHLPGFTEKTFKSIFLSQFPIWLSPYGTVRCYRELGFDAFDDVIDHSYDLEQDPVRRIDMVVEQVQRIADMSLSQLDQMRRDRLDRFQHNFDRLDYYAFNHLAELPIWQKRLAHWLVDQ